MKASDLFKELGMGDEEMNEARNWVNYKHFSETVPDILSLNEYVSTVYKKAVEMDAKPHQWFSERYMTERYISSNVSINSDYIHKLQDRVLDLLDSEHPPHIHKFLKLCIEIVQKDKKALSKDCLIFMNQIHKRKY
jgi:hypothetical protein